MMKEGRLLDLHFSHICMPDWSFNDRKHRWTISWKHSDTPKFRKFTRTADTSCAVSCGKAASKPISSGKALEQSIYWLKQSQDGCIKLLNRNGTAGCESAPMEAPLQIFDGTLSRLQGEHATWSFDSCLLEQCSMQLLSIRLPVYDNDILYVWKSMDCRSECGPSGWKYTQRSTWYAGNWVQYCKRNHCATEWEHIHKPRRQHLGQDWVWQNVAKYWAADSSSWRGWRIQADTESRAKCSEGEPSPSLSHTWMWAWHIYSVWTCTAESGKPCTGWKSFVQFSQASL